MARPFLPAAVWEQDAGDELAVLLAEQRGAVPELERSFAEYRLANRCLEAQRTRPLHLSLQASVEALRVSSGGRVGYSAADLTAELRRCSADEWEGPWVLALSEPTRGALQPTAAARGRIARLSEHAQHAGCAGGLEQLLAGDDPPQTPAEHAAAINAVPKILFQRADAKGRYGGVLRPYAALWARRRPGEGFWQWLDGGGGRAANLPQVPRRYVDTMRVCSVGQHKSLFEADIVGGKMRWRSDGSLVQLPYTTTTSDPPRTYRERAVLDDVLRPCMQQSVQQDEVLGCALQEARDLWQRCQAFEDHSDKFKQKLCEGGVYQRDLSTWQQLVGLLKEQQPLQWPGGARWTKPVFCVDAGGSLLLAERVRGFLQHSSLAPDSTVAGSLSVCMGTVVSVAPHQGYAAPSARALVEMLERWGSNGVDLSAVAVR